MPNDRPKGCDDCDGIGFRQVLVIDGASRAIWAAPCDCPKGRAISHPIVPDEKVRPPQPFYEFAEMHRRKGHEVHVTDQYEPRIPLSLSNPAAWERAKGELRKNPKNPYRSLVDSWQYIEDQTPKPAADWNDEDTTVIPAPEAP